MQRFIDASTILLVSTNLAQMSLIAYLMLPITDIVNLSKYIKHFYENLKSKTKRPYFYIASLIYFSIIVIFGIFSPMFTLLRFEISKASRANETPTETVISIIAAKNAKRNYLLASFSLFFLLVTWRLLELIMFSARLHEFTDLMKNYKIIDISFSQVVKEDEDVICIKMFEEYVDDNDDETQWPAIVNLNSTETLLLKSFLERTPHVYAPLQAESCLVIPGQAEEGQ